MHALPTPVFLQGDHSPESLGCTNPSGATHVGAQEGGGCLRTGATTGVPEGGGKLQAIGRESEDESEPADSLGGDDLVHR